MREEHFRFISNDNQTSIHGIRWIPEGEVRAVLQIAHGMAEHIMRYQEFAEYMTFHGILVTGHDHLGHGESVSSVENYGYFAEKNGNQVLVRDMHRVYHLTKKSYDHVPYILLGHSMGSFLARQYICSYGSELEGVILSGTGYQPEGLLKAALTICRLEAAGKGWRFRSRLFQWMVSGRYNAAFRPNRTSFDWLTREEEIVDRYVEDPACGFAFTLNGYYNLFLTLFKIGRREYLERMPRSLPVLFISGEQDPVGDNGKGVQRAVELFKKTGMKNVECRLYPEARHEVFNERNKEEVYAELLRWMEHHLAI